MGTQRYSVNPHPISSILARIGHLVGGAQAEGGVTKYGAIASPDELRRNLAMHAIPERILDEEIDYQEFLDERRKLMSEKMREYFGTL